MARKPINVLVFPFRKNADGEYEYAVFKRSGNPFWQAISGGVEDGEHPVYSASREAFEEAGIPMDRKVYPLTSRGCVPANIFADSKLWGAQIYTVEEHHFAIEAHEHDIILSHEHTEYKWLSFDEAREIFRFDSNKTGLYELHSRLFNEDMPKE